MESSAQKMIEDAQAELSRIVQATGLMADPKVRAPSLEAVAAMLRRAAKELRAEHRG